MSEMHCVCEDIKTFLNKNKKYIAHHECRTKKCNCDTQGYPCKIYNEFSLQHELGLYLKNKYKDFIILFEKNVKDMDTINFKGWVKYEIDIVIIDKKDFNNKYAIELKFPKNGQYPEQMYNFIKDIKFMEQVKEILKFKKTYCLTLVNNPSFYSSKSLSERTIEIGREPYIYFRKEKNEKIPSSIEIKNPINHKNINKDDPIKIKLDEEYLIQWKNLSNDNNSKIRYYLIETKNQIT